MSGAIIDKEMAEGVGHCHKKAWAAMLLAHAASTRKIDAALRNEGLPTLEVYDVLLALEGAPDRKMRMVDLAQEVVFSPSGLTRLVDRMQAAGLVERHACARDRRAIYVAITPRGLGARDKAWPRYAELIQEHFARWISDEEAACVAQALERVRRSEGMRSRCSEAED